MKEIDFTINEGEKLFSKKRANATKDLVIRIALIFAGILGMTGSILSAPGLLLLGGASITVLTGISLIKTLYDSLDEKRNQHQTEKVLNSLKKLQENFSRHYVEINKTNDRCFYKKETPNFIPIANIDPQIYATIENENSNEI